EDDAPVVRELRLRALREESDAFGSSYEEESRLPIDATVARIAAKRGTDDLALGAFDEGGVLVGIVTFIRRDKMKERHKSDVFGMYVAPEARRKGVGGALLDEVLRHARALEGLDQIQLAVGSRRPAARALYTSRGFEPWGIERRALRIGEDFVDEEYLVLFL